MESKTNLGDIMVKYKKNKYKTGDKVYSYQNPKEAMPISHIRKGVFGDKYSITAYKLALKERGSSKWINEKSLSKRRKK